MSLNKKKSVKRMMHLSKKGKMSIKQNQKNKSKNKSRNKKIKGKKKK